MTRFKVDMMVVNSVVEELLHEDIPLEEHTLVVERILVGEHILVAFLVEGNPEDILEASLVKEDILAAFLVEEHILVAFLVEDNPEDILEASCLAEDSS